ncbi:uncharacterized protein LOC110028653 [Phalaenopsis equestris]|uniref:uncharacterized protein LOC110028653 n=1 Tax=Phalaenopsis equestris TaxID=78828 RepID=UPI0009E1AE88|nr:uncharacterized protein LOC110028653 [Phalaenopsis equestris]
MNGHKGEATFTYVGCTKDARKELWNRCQQVNSPWLVGGDFNCIISTTEKSGGRTPNLAKMNTFRDNIHRAGLFDLGFKGPNFTWKRGSIWERLDRMLVNDAWFNYFLLSFVTHLSLAGLDHRPILMSITSTDNYSSPSPLDISTCGLHILHIIAKALRGWSWNTFGNVHATVQKVEGEVKALENGGLLGIEEEKKLLIAHNNVLSAIDYKEKFLKQKEAMNIFTNGDRNTRFFNAYIKYKRKCNTIHAIQNVNGQWLHNNNDIANDAICFYKELLNQEHNLRPHIEKAHFMEELNYTVVLKLTDIPTEKEIWNAISSIDSTKSAGPNGFTAEFYKKSWKIFKTDVIVVVTSFFQGNNLPNYFCSSTTVLIPKSEIQKNW